MVENNLIKKITAIIIQQTVSHKIPTVVFLSDIGKGDLVRSLFWTLKSGNKNEATFTPDDWKEVADIMQKLTDIPLLLKEVTDINELKNDIECFISGMGNRKGIVITNSNLPLNPFTKKENISIINI